MSKSLEAIEKIRAEALESGELAGKSVKEIEEMIAKCNSQSEQLTLMMMEKNEVAEKLDDTESRIMELEDALAAAKAENKELAARPIEVSSSQSEADIEKIRKDVKKELEADYKSKKDKLKAEAESAAAKKVEDDKKAAVEAAVKAAKAEAEAAKAILNALSQIEKRIKG